MAARSTKVAAPASDGREAFLARHISPWAMKLSAEALDDVRYFAKRSKEGRPITISGLERWLDEKHNLRIGRERLATLCREHGVEPWWAVRSRRA